CTEAIRRCCDAVPASTGIRSNSISTTFGNGKYCRAVTSGVRGIEESCIPSYAGRNSIDACSAPIGMQRIHLVADCGLGARAAVYFEINGYPVAYLRDGNHMLCIVPIEIFYPTCWGRPIRRHPSIQHFEGVVHRGFETVTAVRGIGGNRFATAV